MQGMMLRMEFPEMKKQLQTDLNTLNEAVDGKNWTCAIQIPLLSFPIEIIYSQSLRALFHIILKIGNVINTVSA